MRRFVRVAKKLGKGILVFMAILVMALTITRWVFIRQLNAEIAMIKERGEPLTEAEMQGPPVPDAENAALVYERAFKELPPDKVFWDQTEKIRQLLEKSDPGSLEKARRMMKPYARALALTRQAASMPKCRFTTDRNVKFLDSPGLKLRHLSQVTLLYAALDARSGRMDNAVDNLMVSLAMDNVPSVKDDAVSALMQGSMVTWTCTTTREIADCGRINEQQARRLYSQLAKVDIRAIHMRGLQGERAYLLSIDHSDPITCCRKRGIKVSAWDAFWARINPVDLTWGHVILIGDQAAQLRYYRKLIGSDRRTYREYHSRTLELERGIPFYAILTKILAPVNTECLDSVFDAQAQVDGSRVFLALLAYHDRHGAYPSSLAELRKDLGWSVPRDPFNGREFVYGLKGDGFVLYSVGPDLKDNDGRPELKGKAHREGAEYDIPWEMSH